MKDPILSIMIKICLACDYYVISIEDIYDFQKFFLFFFVFFFFDRVVSKKIIYNDQDNEINICLSGKIDTVTISDINVDLLNKVIKTDKTFATKTTFDTNIDINSPIVKARISPRNKAVWGVINKMLFNIQKLKM